MCARTTLMVPSAVLEALGIRYGVSIVQPRYNIAPTQPIAVVRLDPDGARRLDLLRFGLLPPWAKTPGAGSKFINARAETLFEASAFREAAEVRRCVVVADGFYEWKRAGGVSLPYLFRRSDGLPFGLAGIWSRWTPRGGGEAIESCSIVTTEAAAPVAAIHDRMAVLLRPEQLALWLDPTVRGEDAKRRLAPLLLPADRPELVGYRVGPRVNRPQNDDPECAAPLTEEEPAPPAGGQQRLPFG
jgi:putative SOS response-associated peptidase YedK